MSTLHPSPSQPESEPADSTDDARKDQHDDTTEEQDTTETATEAATEAATEVTAKAATEVTAKAAAEVTAKAAAEVTAKAAPEETKDAPSRLDPEAAPPLPDEAPPLPNEAPPTEEVDDGWQPIWDENAQAFYFYNRFSQLTQWENPRVPSATQTAVAPASNRDREASSAATAATAAATPVTRYNPAIHGDYDPNADYARAHQSAGNVADAASLAEVAATNIGDAYLATGAFNRFTGKWQDADFTPDRFGDEAKSKRQMHAFFDVDAAANSHDGRSLRAERQQKKLSKKELKAFKEKRREKKEEKRRAWLKD